MEDLDEDEMLQLAIRMSRGESVEVPAAVRMAQAHSPSERGRDLCDAVSDAGGDDDPMGPWAGGGNHPMPPVNSPRGGPEVPSGPNMLERQFGNTRMEPENFLPAPGGGGHIPFVGETRTAEEQNALNNFLLPQFVDTEDAEMEEAIRQSLLESQGQGAMANQPHGKETPKLPMNVGKQTGNSLGATDLKKAAMGTAPPPPPPVRGLSKRGREETGDSGPPLQKATFLGGSKRTAFLNKGSEEIQELYDLCFGDNADPSDLERWERARFEFSDKIRFGLIQKQGGPCGILAAVQGTLLQQLLFGSDGAGSSGSKTTSPVGTTPGGTATTTSSKTLPGGVLTGTSPARGSREGAATGSISNEEDELDVLSARLRESSNLGQESLQLLTDERREALLCNALCKHLEQARYLSSDFKVVSATRRGGLLQFSKVVTLRSRQAVIEHFRKQITMRIETPSSAGEDSASDLDASAVNADGKKVVTRISGGKEQFSPAVSPAGGVGAAASGGKENQVASSVPPGGPGTDAGAATTASPKSSPPPPPRPIARPPAPIGDQQPSDEAGSSASSSSSTLLVAKAEEAGNAANAKENNPSTSNGNLSSYSPASRNKNADAPSAAAANTTTTTTGATAVANRPSSTTAKSSSSTSKDGVLLAFVFSLLVTRGLDNVRNDMDDSEQSLVARFGHCSQELVNLMLQGEATTNVFDGTQQIGTPAEGGLQLRGVLKEVPVGYLSELEAMRHCEVGNRYKYPSHPLWMLASPDHFTILFGQKMEYSAKSRYEQVKQDTEKSFYANAIDTESGLAMVEKLTDIIQGLTSFLSPEQQSELYASLTEQADTVILWNDFWNEVQMRALKPEDIAAESSGGAMGKIDLWHYDGQEPPGAVLRRIQLEPCDLPPSVGGQDGDAHGLISALRTRWKNALFHLEM
ncbi:unnamed protein product [Amoebophrya sp. A25]|nr:unnamed protein product [Amoebophrya sp. A25]|eukprot:GSA25T00009270001.1